MSEFQGVSVTVLGPVGARASDGSSLKLSASARRLVAILVAAGPEGATTDTIADALWQGSFPTQWQAAIRMAVSRLRNVFSPSGTEISLEAGRYSLKLSTDQVDAWWLSDLVEDPDASISENDLRRALGGVPFGGIDVNGVIARADRHYLACQTEVAVRYCLGDGPMAAPIATLLREHQRMSDPYNEHLARSIAGRMGRAGMGQAAVSYLDDFVKSFRDGLGRPPAGFSDLRADSDPSGGPSSGPEGSSGGGPTASVGSAGQATLHRPSVLPPALAPFESRPLYGRDGEVDAIRGRTRSIVTGSSGAGKTALMARLSQHAIDHGETISYLSAGSAATNAYEPFIAEFAELRETLTRSLGADSPESEVGADTRVFHSQCQLQVLTHLEGLAAGNRHWVLFDDAHAYDEASSALIEFLGRAATSDRLVLVIACRLDVTDSDWAKRCHNLTRNGFEIEALGSLTPASIELMISDALPQIRMSASAYLAAEIVVRNAALPLAAERMISMIDRNTLSFDERIHAGRKPGGARHAPPLHISSEALEVAVAAAVLGDVFAVGDLIALCGGDSDAVDAALAELWGRGALTETGDVHRLQFANALIRDEVRAAVPPYRLEQLNLQAADLTDDVYDLAAHLAAAGELVPTEVAVEALTTSAERHAKAAMWRAAATELLKIEEIADDGLDVDQLVLKATALDLSGAGGLGSRRKAFRLASELGRWDAAIAAGLSGLPEAERPDGEPERIEMLESIPDGVLDAGQSFARAEALARLHALNGSPDDADVWAEEAARLAADQQHEVRADIARWTVAHHIKPAGFEFAKGSTTDVGPYERLQVIQMQTISAVENLRFRSAMELHEQLVALADEVGDPARIWQAKVLGSTLRFDDGDWDEAEALSNEAHDYGRQHGMQQAGLVFAGQDFHRRSVERRQGELEPSFERMKTDVGGSSIASAAGALVLHACGREQEAWDGVEPTVIDALDRPRSASVVVLALLSGLIASSGSPELISRVRDRLIPFADLSLIVGYGIGSTGPLRRLIAPLAVHHDERVQWLEAAVRSADRSQALTWRVVTRLALAADIPEGADLRRQAEGIAKGTPAAALVLRNLVP